MPLTRCATSYVQHASALAFPVEHLEPLRPLRDLAQGDDVPHRAPSLLMAAARADMPTVLTDKPGMVIARPPKRTRKPKPEPKISRVIVGSRKPTTTPPP
jgi:hypothetical protein